jgi:hypothetical protein
MTRARRRLTPAVTLALALAAWLAPAAARAESFAEFVGRSDQDGPQVTHFGYVTHLQGFTDAELFFDPLVRTEATARLTFFATTTLNARHQVANVITTATAPGPLTFYLRPGPGASFGDPASFQVGDPVATMTVRYHNTLIVDEQPNSLGQSTGRASAVADAEGSGLRLRITASGQGTLLVDDPTNPVSVVVLGGTIVSEP